MGFYPFVATIGGIVPPLPIAQGGTGTTTAAGALAALPLPWVPADQGLLACNDYLALSQATAAVVAGTLYLSKVQIRTAITWTNVSFFVSTAGSGASTGSFAGLYNSAGTLLTGSADIAAALTVAAGETVALTTPQSLAAGTFVWVALLANLATTQPAFRSVQAQTSTIPSFGLTAATFRSATNGTGLSSLPASITPASNTASPLQIWVGAS